MLTIDVRGTRKGSKCFKGCISDFYGIYDAMCPIHDLPSFLRGTIEVRILYSICVAGKDFIHRLLHSILSKHFHICCKERKLSERIHILDKICFVLLTAWQQFIFKKRNLDNAMLNATKSEKQKILKKRHIDNAMFNVTNSEKWITSMNIRIKLMLRAQN